jgi:hypothetical protein
MKLTKTQLAEREALVAKLSEAALAVSAAVDKFNLMVDDLKTPVGLALEAYNAVVDECRDLVERVVEEAEAEFDSKSERWQDSPRGQAASAFKAQWEDVGLEPVDLDLPDEVSFDDPEYSDVLNALPAEPEE